MTVFKLQNKRKKNNLRIIFKPHAYLQTMSKTPVKFQWNRHKTVSGVAHKRYPIHIHFCCKKLEKMMFKFTSQKSDKTNQRITAKNMHIFRPCPNTFEVSKESL